MARSAPNDPLDEQAAEWIVLLSSDDAAERVRARREFEAWKEADPRHAEAAARMEDFIGRVRGLRETGAEARPARAALEAGWSAGRAVKGRRAKRIGAALALAVVLAAPAWLAFKACPPDYLLADLRTGAGDWRTHALADGTRVTLNGGSAVNLRYDDRRRALELVQGEILVDVAKEVARPFLVETAQGSIRALGTRFLVRRDGEATVLTMLESKVSVIAAWQRQAGLAPDGPHGIVVRAGQRVRIAADGVGAAEPVDVRAVADAWRFHQLVVADRPLPEVLDELNRHRPGRILYARGDIAAVRVSAVLPLDDTDRALRLLARGFPQLRMHTLTPWLVFVDAAGVP